MFRGTTNEKIDEYIITLKMCLIDKECKLIIHWNKNKNFVFNYLYSIKNEDVKNILLSLDSNDFSEIKVSNHPGHFGELLYVFTPVRDFIAANGDTQRIRLYIKIHIVEDKTIVDVISFHEFGKYKD